MKRFGLKRGDAESLQKLFKQFPPIEEVTVFGSRAMGNAKKGSDIDLSVRGSGVDDVLLNDLRIALNQESVLPYFFDVVGYDSVDRPELKRHIDRHGKILYKK